MNQFWTIMKGLGKREKEKMKQYSGLTPESFSNHQYDPLLNSVFSEGLDEDLATLSKDNLKLNSPGYINALVILWRSQLFKTIKRKKGGIYEKYEPSIAPIKYTQCRLLKVNQPLTGLIPNQ